MTRSGTTTPVVVCVALIRADARTGRPTILLVRTRDRPFILPGGKLETGETELHALRREVHEELPGIRLGQPWLWRRLCHQSMVYRRREFAVYISDFSGRARIGAEIAEARWTMAPLKRSDLSPVTREICTYLHAEGYLCERYARTCASTTS